MFRNLLAFAVVLSLVFVVGGLAFAQADEEEDGWVTFASPTALEPNTEYDFSFSVFHNAPAPTDQADSYGIQQVDIMLPTEGYVLDEANQPEPPECIHSECRRWEMMIDSSVNTISWSSFGATSSVEYGDLREQDVQTFRFVATTDDKATDGFNWSLWGEDGELVMEGEWFFSDEEADDDDQGDDDDDDDGCGC